MDCGGIQCGPMDPHRSFHLRRTILLSEEVPDRADGLQADSRSWQTGGRRVCGSHRSPVHSYLASLRKRILESERAGNNGILGVPV